MRRKVIFLILAALLIVLLGAFTFFFLRIRHGRDLDQGFQKSEETRYIPRSENSSIKKGILPDNGGVSYELVGVITEEFSFSGNGSLKGRLVLENDPLGRNIDVYWNPIEDQVYMGIYVESFAGESEWGPVSAEAARKSIDLGEAVKILVMLRKVSAGSQEIFDRSSEKVLDTLNKEFLSGEFKYELPADFGISAETVGIIR